MNKRAKTQMMKKLQMHCCIRNTIFVTKIVHFLKPAIHFLNFFSLLYIFLILISSKEKK